MGFLTFDFIFKLWSLCDGDFRTCKFMRRKSTKGGRTRTWIKLQTVIFEERRPCTELCITVEFLRFLGVSSNKKVDDAKALFLLLFFFSLSLLPAFLPLTILFLYQSPSASLGNLSSAGDGVRHQPR